MSDELMDKAMNRPWQLTLHEAAIFMAETEAENMVVGMKFQNGKTLQVKVTIEEPNSQE